MATTITETDLAALQLSPDRSTVPIATIANGKGRRVIATYTIVSGDEPATNDVIKICKLPNGARLDLRSSYIYCDDPAATAFQVNIGDTDDTVAADPDRYQAALDLDGGGKFLFDIFATKGVALLTPYTVQKECWLEMEVSLATGPTANAMLYFNIVYSLHN